ncbi:MAG: hypothetical protein QM780_10130 [Hyphomicrobium sp.]|uniref:hypothetical protein n=1 Tax=Hyphomicrobium sp. TaxID=82 RepID=UPI0039E224D9
MKRPRREAVGGEVALMAVITKAMGAFLILVVIMLPHYVLSVSNSKTADQAQERADNASKMANEISDTLKKGRLTDEEIDALLRKIEALKQELATLKDEIAQLKNELNQALAEVDRLKKAKEELEAEVARLKKELEELKRSTRPSTIVVASWANCSGSDFDLYVWSDAKGQPTANEKPIIQPTVTRKVQSAFWPGEAKSSLLRGGFRDYGSIWWRTPESGKKETFLIWVKLLNPVYTAKSKARSCSVDIAATSSRGETVEGGFGTGDKWPYGLVVLERGVDGSLSTKTLDESTRTKLRDEYFASACDGLMCFANIEPSPNSDLAKLKATFVAYVAGKISGKEQISGAVFDQMASGAITVEDGYRWLRPAFVYAPPGVFKSASIDDIAEGKKLLKRKGAAVAVESEYIAALSDGRLHLNQLEGELEKVADTKDLEMKPPEAKPAPIFSPKQLEPDIMNEPPH